MVKENNFQSCKKSEFEYSEIYPFGHVSNIYKKCNNFFLKTVNRFIQYYKLLLFFESPNTTGTFDVFLTVHHSIDFSKYQLSAQFF